jgi:hypothetical protein
VPPIIIIIIIVNCKWVDTHPVDTHPVDTHPVDTHPVAVVISHITYAWTVKVDYSRCSWGGLHGKHVVGLHGKHVVARVKLMGHHPEVTTCTVACFVTNADIGMWYVPHHAVPISSTAP